MLHVTMSTLTTIFDVLQNLFDKQRKCLLENFVQKICTLDSMDWSKKCKKSIFLNFLRNLTFIF